MCIKCSRCQLVNVLDKIKQISRIEFVSLNYDVVVIILALLTIKMKLYIELMQIAFAFFYVI